QEKKNYDDDSENRKDDNGCHAAGKGQREELIQVHNIIGGYELNSGDIKLSADDPNDFDGSAAYYGRARFGAGRSGVTGPSLHVGDFSHAMLRDGSNHCGMDADKR